MFAQVLSTVRVEKIDIFSFHHSTNCASSHHSISKLHRLAITASLFVKSRLMSSDGIVKWIPFSAQLHNIITESHSNYISDAVEPFPESTIVILTIIFPRNWFQYEIFRLECLKRCQMRGLHYDYLLLMASELSLKFHKKLSDFKCWMLVDISPFVVITAHC